jgi:creatinine deaminase
VNHAGFLDIACKEALNSSEEGGVVAGAVLTNGGEVIARSGDQSVQLNDPVAVAEMNCIRQAGRRSDQQQLTLYSTRYPNMLTAGTMLQFSLGKLVIGLPESSNQAIELLKSRGVPLEFIAHKGCATL